MPVIGVESLIKLKSGAWYTSGEEDCLLDWCWRMASSIEASVGSDMDWALTSANDPTETKKIIHKIGLNPRFRERRLG